MLKAAIVGATGVVGQQFIVALQNHPWFEIVGLAASERSAGKRYGNAVKDEKSGAMNWFCRESPEPDVLEQEVLLGDTLDASKYDIIFSSLESDSSRQLDAKYARTTPVVSTAAAFRYDDDVPIIIPGVNEEHLGLLAYQKKKRGWEGFISPQPNCTTTGMAITLKPIFDDFGIKNVIMTSMQAVSGAGRSPGVLALDITDNVIPYIPKEEEKVQIEAKKILGKLNSNLIIPADFKVSCTCTRVNVREGHTETVFAETVRKAEPEDVVKSMNRYSKKLASRGLPSAPNEMITVSDDPFRPQPRLDRDSEDGMTTTVGRIRKDAVFENGIKYVLVSHNTKMGAAKGAVLTAEILEKSELL
ncbi:MAG: aspartate-semialdehyde dehydrogenase [Thaumarchaeota archaeon]|nr:aspartate-semialdehyde dehydrogenase [Nitrososphaerota archaeon]